MEDDFAQQLFAAEERITLLIRENKRLKKELREVNFDTQEAITTLEVADSYEKQIKDIKKMHRSEIKELKTVIAEKDGIIESLKSGIAKLRERQPAAPMNDNSKQILEAQISLVREKLKNTESSLEYSNKEIENLKKQINELTSENNTFKCKIDTLNDLIITKDELIDKLEEKRANTKSKLHVEREKLRSKETELAEFVSRLREQELQTAMAKEEVEKLNNQKEIIEQQSDNSFYLQEVELYRERFQNFEALYKAQSEEITELQDNRTKLIVQLQNALDALKYQEVLTQKLSQRAAAISINNQNLAEQTAAAMEAEDDAFNTAFDHVLDIVPPTLADQIQDFGDLTKSAIFSRTIETLIEYFTKNDKEDHFVDDSESIQKIQIRLSATLSHLENTLKFMKKVAQSSTIESHDSKTEIIQQCARIAQFIDDCRYEYPSKDFTRTSIFDPQDLCDPERIANLFYDYINEKEDLTKEPYIELYTLFCCLAQVNAMLFAANDQATQRNTELQSAADNSAKLAKRLDEAESEIERLGNIHIKLTPIMSRFVQSPAEDFEDLACQFANAVEECPLTAGERDRLVDELEGARATKKALRRELKNRDAQHEEEKAAFCAQADSLVEKLQREIQDMKLAMSSEKKEIEASKDDKNGLTNRLETQISEIKEELVNKENDITKLREELKKADQRLEEAEKTIREKQSLLTTAEHDLANLKESSEASIRELVGALKKAQLNRQRAKQRATSAEEKNAETLKSVKERTDALEHQYLTSMAQLQEELSQARQLQREAEERLAQIEPQRQAMIKENARLRLAEKSASMRADDLENALKQSRSEAEARQNAQALLARQNLANARDAYERELNILRTALSEIAETDDDSMEGKELTDAALAAVARKTGASDARALQEASHLRRSLGLTAGETLSERFTELSNRVFASEIEASKARADLGAIQRTNEKLERDIARLEGFRSESGDWTRWARTLYRAVSEKSPATVPPKELRFILEEAIVASLGFRSVTRKIDILRGQKRILLAVPKPLLAQRGGKVGSLRPVTLTVVCAHRLLAIACAHKPRFVPPSTPPKAQPVVPLE